MKLSETQQMEKDGTASLAERTPSTGERERAALGLGAAIFIETAAAFVFFISLPALLSLVLHVLASAMLMRAVALLRGRGLAVLCGALALLVPGYGLVTTLALLLLTQLRIMPQGGRLVSLREHLRQGEPGTLPGAAARGEREMLEEMPPESLAAMLDTDDLQMKRTVIDVMAERKERLLVAKVVECLRDPHPEISRYALGRLTQIHEEFTSSISSALEQLRREPESLRLHTAIVDLYERYLETGLVDQTLEGYYTEQILNESQDILRLSPRELSPRFSLARILLKRGMFEEALGQYQKILVKEGRNIEARFGAAECFYHLGRYGEMLVELRTVLTCGFTLKGSNRAMIDTAQWWLTA